MADFTTPEVYHIANTGLDTQGVNEFFIGLGVDDWETNAPSDSEELIEIAGRRCYNSFVSETVAAGELNKNISKVREGNQPYLKNILAVNHGALLEHCTDTYMFHNVSRVFTHELVRHRVGTAYSQESLRYVRLTDIKMWLPGCFENLDQEAYDTVRHEFYECMLEAEARYMRISDAIGIDTMKNFSEKKKYTSAMRRIMPIGLSTGICVTANHRTWRHTIELRTSRHAEEEIRIVFGIVARDLASMYPNLYQDMSAEIVDGYFEYTFGHKD